MTLYQMQFPLGSLHLVMAAMALLDIRPRLQFADKDKIILKFRTILSNSGLDLLTEYGTLVSFE